MIVGSRARGLGRARTSPAPRSPRSSKAGDNVFNGFGTIVLLLAALGLVSVMALNMYGGSLTLISAIDSFKQGAADGRRSASSPSGSPRRCRSIGALARDGELPRRTSTTSCCSSSTCSSRGRRSTSSTTTSCGAATTRSPRSSTHAASTAVGAGAASRPTSSASRRWSRSSTSPRRPARCSRDPSRMRSNGADISFFIGLPVAGVLYWVLCRSIDVDAEARLAQAEAAELRDGRACPPLNREPPSVATAAAIDATAIADADARVRCARSTSSRTRSTGSAATVATPSPSSRPTPRWPPPREVDAGRRTGPLAGVPITVKDHVWVAGLPATNGSRALADFVPDRSAVCVERLVDGRRGHRRQDEQPRVLLPRRHRQRAVRRDAQPARPVAHGRRVEWRRGGVGGGRRRPAGRRHRRRRLDPHPVRVLRRRTG